ncbi:MAG TPA: choice-of-anchor L domain-containing protein [Catalimonadaceae bacterium]|nr:choice-of-anchor L domain-containing protein [Catalimonadaceae bacterium]
MRFRIAILLFTAAMLCFSQVKAQLHITKVDSVSYPIDSLIRKLAGFGVSVTNIKSNLHSSTRSLGTFLSMNPTFPISTGLIMSTGYADTVAGSNSSSILSTNIPYSDTIDGLSDGRQMLKIILENTGTGSASGKPTDVTTIRFDLVPIGDSVKFRFIFSSDEYPQYVCSNFNDVFGFFIKGPGITGDPMFDGTHFEGFRNMAIIPGTNLPVSINTVNSGVPGSGSPTNCTFTEEGKNQFVRNDSVQHPLYSILKMNGLTKVLEAKSAVSPCETYTLLLSVADVTDRRHDSNVFLEQGSLISGNYSEFKPAFTNGLDDTITRCHPGKLIFSRCPTAMEDLWKVQYTIEGSAQPGVDYKRLLPDGSLADFPDFITLQPGHYTDSLMIQPTGNGADLRNIKLRFLNIQNPYAFGQPNYSGESVRLLIRPIPVKPINQMNLCWFDSSRITFQGPALPDLNYVWKELVDGQETAPVNLSCTDCQSPFVYADSATHLYKVLISNPYCQLQDTVRIVPLPIISPLFLSGPGWLQLENPQTGYVYTWKVNGITQSGDPTEPLMYSPGDEIHFSAVAPNGCSREMDLEAIMTGNKKESEQKTGLVLFPNPGKGLMHIAGVESGPAQIRLTGTDGKVYMERNLRNGEITFNTQGLPAGIYWFEVKNQRSGQRNRLKFVKLAD